MVSYRSSALKAALLTGTALLTTNAFVNSPASFGIQTKLNVATEFEIDSRTGKRTGNSFLSEETKERGRNGNPIEKIKQAKDATAAFVDVYEYAAKIRAGEMDWKDVEKADLDNVSYTKYMNILAVCRHMHSHDLENIICVLLCDFDVIVVCVLFWEKTIWLSGSVYSVPST